jgi:N-acetylneuraminic acid mutarotase
MNKVLVFVLVIFLITVSFIATVNFVSASGLVKNSWTTKTPMSEPRVGFGVVAVNGKIYAIGGATEATKEVGTNERYDPISDTWVTLAPMPTPRTDFAILAYENKIYCIGGGYMGMVEEWGVPARLEVNTVEVYDIVTDSWSTKTSAPFGGNTNFQMHIIDGNFFAIVGLHSGLVYMYNPLTDVWTQKAIVPIKLEVDGSTTMLSTFVSVVTDNKIIGLFNFYVVNTDDFSYRYQKTMVYDPTTDMWTEKTTIPYDLSPISSIVLVDDKIVCFSFGLFASEGDSPFQLGVLIYDIKADVWSRGKSGPSIIRVDAAVVTTGGYAPQRVYVLGKQYDTTYLSNWVYDPVGESWSSAKNMPSDQSEYGVVIVDDIIYVISGSLNEQYVPIGYNDPLSSGIGFSLNITTLVVVVLVLTVGVVCGIFFFFKKRKSVVRDISVF